MRGSLVTIAGAALAAALACGGKDEPTTTEGSQGTSGAGSSQTSDAASSSSTAAPTTGSGSSSSSSSTGPSCETSASDCGVSVDGVMSSCPDPPPANNELIVEALGPGQIKITEYGHDANCGLQIAPIVNLYAGNQIFVTYMINGQPMEGCTCKYTITSTLSGLAAGSWKVVVMPYEQMVDVP